MLLLISVEKHALLGSAFLGVLHNSSVTTETLNSHCRVRRNYFLLQVFVFFILHLMAISMYALTKNHLFCLM